MHEHTEHLVPDDIVEHAEIREYTPEQALEHFNAAAQFHMKISGDEFRERWHRGDYDEDLDRPEVMAVAMLLPMVERETATYP